MIEINNLSRSKIESEKLRSAAEKFLSEYKIKNKTLSIALVGDARIKELNRRYRRQSRITDILSFAGEGDDLGELVINCRQIKRQAEKQGKSSQEELVFILVHGLLHLAGYDDSSAAAAAEMEQRGNDFIKKHLKPAGKK